MTLLGASNESMKSESEIVYQQFLESLKSEETKRNYVYAVDAFLRQSNSTNKKLKHSLFQKQQIKSMIKSTKIKIHIKHIWKKILVLLTISNKKPPIQSNQFSTTI